MILDILGLGAKRGTFRELALTIGIGMTQGAEVEYSLRAIPLGGYVGFPDDDPSNGFPKDDPDLLQNRGVKDRALVISAGVIANFIFAYLILLGQVCTASPTSCMCCGVIASIPF
jgi:membrane-associated protease RseP (regulator of RpoE activity)